MEQPSAHDCDLGSTTVDYVLSVASFTWNLNYLQFLKTEFAFLYKINLKISIVQNAPAHLILVLHHR